MIIGIENYSKNSDLMCGSSLEKLLNLETHTTIEEINYYKISGPFLKLKVMLVKCSDEEQAAFYCAKNLLEKSKVDEAIKIFMGYNS